MSAREPIWSRVAITWRALCAVGSLLVWLGIAAGSELLLWVALALLATAPVAYMLGRLHPTCPHHLHVDQAADTQRQLLDGWRTYHSDPDSGLWAVTPPCGYGYWSLWPPGSADPDADYPYAGREPAAQHPAREGENGLDDLAAIRGWLLPWIEQHTGGRVVDVVDGWDQPYGPCRQLREYVIYAEVAR